MRPIVLLEKGQFHKKNQPDYSTFSVCERCCTLHITNQQLVTALEAPPTSHRAPDMFCTLFWPQPTGSWKLQSDWLFALPFFHALVFSITLTQWAFQTELLLSSQSSHTSDFLLPISLVFPLTFPAVMMSSVTNTLSTLPWPTNVSPNLLEMARRLDRSLGKSSGESKTRIFFIWRNWKSCWKEKHKSFYLIIELMLEKLQTSQAWRTGIKDVNNI